ncbi:GTP pyrophosphokinase family protein [Corynebacterium ulcerans]|uniref:RelA/SpoT domain-containing protein n=1 Tax=Corynebacterium ulcerans TaxID=65058 RepID=A0ABD7MR76_CORUL|nr:GTP pyrophosphokinase [Corynebacterium ulcerans]MBH5298059.1 GTP pyrophosphokinase family protein [Corynebacterium ulcerans]QQU25229.1 GTP pyrophosphokinase family protein [Corynebacterium ulcerans]SNV05406.1 RelA/SpoT domain-containing protein [Corynebacterium ulcerans]SQG50183.1 RelA/SpoT domain-containing protein [Corynebacterium ulcerans]SQH01609.1 RelA/SpoT domain-containing protein [Corynebacterium ulcerans]
MPNKFISKLSARYREFTDQHPHAEADFREAFEEVLADAGLTYDRVSVRLKEWQSLRTKARKKKPNGHLIYPDPWVDIHDVIGVRITTLHSTEIPQIIEALADVFIVLRSVDKAAQTKVSGSFGYGSHHLILEVDHRIEDLASYHGFVFEVQIRTVLQHAWAEFEHDVRYKRSGGLDPQVDRAFTLAAGLIELADQQFDQIAAIQDPGHHHSTDLDVELSAETLPGVIAMLVGNRFPQSRIEDYRWLEELLFAHGITTATKLRDLLNDADIDAVRRALNYQFQPGQVRIIDDLLLRRYHDEHINATGKSGKYPRQRGPRLRKRLHAMQTANILDKTEPRSKTELAPHS